MDFDLAAQRLQRDHTKLLKQKNKNGQRSGRVVELSAKASREAALRKKQQEQLQKQRNDAKKKQEYITKYMIQCERSLRIKHLTSITESSLQLQPTSIYGDGDKIALPPSILETLTNTVIIDDNNNNNNNKRRQQQQQPWTFRIGILNPDYTFPASPILQMKNPPNEDDDEYHDDDDDDETDSNNHTEAYLDELQHKYLAYTHGTVVEFTQEEGYVGIPKPIATALLTQIRKKNNSNFPTMRTKDVATTTSMEKNANDMDIDYNNSNDEEKTPGHIAWGAFDLPDTTIEITLLELPKGRKATLQPTIEAIRCGFYNLKDIKYVLEQSLSRTRATLSIDDIIHTWHRGIKYDLSVTSVTPNTYNSISIINTDIEIDFEEQHIPNADVPTDSTSAAVASSVPTEMSKVSVGRRLIDEKETNSSEATTTTPVAPIIPIQSSLPPEPPIEQKDNVVTIQIRGGTVGAPIKRRFNITTATIMDLFALIIQQNQYQHQSFQLVTRFPRRVFQLNEQTKIMTLQQAGIMAGQELFMVENI